ncbi:DUF3105 domain-containing protein [Herbiconiux sp. CPCC 205716]|uniref:DUF3105 domain-containing protein n=1 Tax=Herbiconiux gentiana TaxID=2970912 RepID=A0ABT2GH65_9MICO|nr:DUF3105 domain-containing protein [Herbiconiux gentiana]MCS5715563.1 DUF3105 domain-containing protein [Herbiconiux gentiana]
MRPVPSEPTSSVPPKAKDQAKKLTVKQEREARRAEKVAQMIAQQKKQQRNRRIGIFGGAAAGVIALGLVITFVVTSAEPKVDPASISIGELQSYDNLTSNHVTGTVDYAQTPPAGGDHNAVWLNCGVYDQAVPNENAVHALEHGAVWVTYDPAVVDEAGVETLRSELPDTYVVLSPYEGLASPVVASAWGNQVFLDGVDDERLGDFVQKFWRSNDAPEPGAACTGGLDASGKVA